MDLTPQIIALTLAGAAAGGFVNGLAGFGTGLFALGFWLQAFPPLEAVALSVVTATVTGLQGAWVVRHEIRANLGRLMRFLVPALFGIPLGVSLLILIEPRVLKLVIAGFLLFYGGFFLLRGALPTMDRTHPAVEAVVGFFSGVLGGLAGLSGVFMVTWCAMRPWPRRQTRALLQPFNLVVLVVTSVILAVRGAYSVALLPALGLAIVTAMLSAQIGIFAFHRMGDTQFRWVLIGLMFVSGLALGLREVAM